MAKLEASDTVVLGISIDSPAANAAFAKQIGVTFPLLSDGWKTVKLSDYRGKKNVFLAVYVLAFTGG